MLPLTLLVYSLYGRKFPDETFALNHDREGLLTTANVQGQNSNDARFIITLAPAQWLNRRSVVFGEVIKGMDLVRQIER